MPQDDRFPTTRIVSLKVELIDSDPLIWREVEIPVDITLRQLNHVVQAVMGWEDAHLWSFTIGKRDTSRNAASKVQLADLLGPRSTRFIYTYDFGDSWEHLLKFGPPRAGQAGHEYPRLIGGERAAPPEDCGGIPGFYYQLEILGNPQHPEHDDVTEWFGPYDPTLFPRDVISAELSRLAALWSKSTARQSP